ncbi:hypothetical protein M1N61_01025 [Peptococcaceae bacterium]|nr:hypothetical protein [Peptococcaceae bacterium]
MYSIIGDRITSQQRYKSFAQKHEPNALFYLIVYVLLYVSGGFICVLDQAFFDFFCMAI